MNSPEHRNNRSPLLIVGEHHVPRTRDEKILLGLRAEHSSDLVCVRLWVLSVLSPGKQTKAQNRLVLNPSDLNFGK